MDPGPTSPKSGMPKNLPAAVPAAATMVPSAGAPAQVRESGIRLGPHLTLTHGEMAVGVSLCVVIIIGAVSLASPARRGMAAGLLFGGLILGLVFGMSVRARMERDMATKKQVNQYEQQVAGVSAASVSGLVTDGPVHGMAYEMNRPPSAEDAIEMQIKAIDQRIAEIDQEQLELRKRYETYIGDAVDKIRIRILNLAQERMMLWRHRERLLMRQVEIDQKLAALAAESNIPALPSAYRVAHRVEGFDGPNVSTPGVTTDFDTRRPATYSWEHSMA